MKMMVPLLKIILCALIALSHQQVYAGASGNIYLRSTQAAFNNFKTSHDLASGLLKNYNLSSSQRNYINKILLRESVRLPKVKFRNNTLYFKVGAKNHSFEFVKEGTYKVNGRAVRLNLTNEHLDTYAGVFDRYRLMQMMFFIQEAQAAPWLLFLVVFAMGTLTLSFFCSGQTIKMQLNISDSFTYKTVKAKDPRLRRLNQKINESIRAVLPQCGAAGASVTSIGLEYINYDKFFRDYCDNVAREVVRRAASQSNIKPFDDKGDYNPRFENQLKELAPVYRVGDVVPKHLRDLSVDLCTTPQCRDKVAVTTKFDDLSEPSREIIRAHLLNRGFARSCIVDAFYRQEAANQADLSPSPNISESTGAVY